MNLLPVVVGRVQVGWAWLGELRISEGWPHACSSTRDTLRWTEPGGKAGLLPSSAVGWGALLAPSRDSIRPYHPLDPICLQGEKLGDLREQDCKAMSATASLSVPGQVCL